MNQPHPLDLASINARLVADKACDELEGLLLAGKTIDWVAVFTKIDDSAWSTLVEYLIDFLRQSRIVNSDEGILSLFEPAPSDIRQLVAQRLAVTVQNVDMESVEDLPSQEVEDFVPEQIEHFRIKKQIGLGGFGRVLLAQDMMLQKEVVLKIPRRSSRDRQRNLNAFVDEARKASLLDSKGVVPIYHIGTFSGIPYIVQPFIRGGDLGQALATRQFTFVETASIIAAVATTIADAHRKRLLHRDLKPANILLDDDGHPLVADFGLAIHESAQYEARGILAGSKHYMSPEQIRGETHHMDGRSDIWSLGVILYQMLVNDLPFRASEHSPLRTKICQQPPLPPRQLKSNVPQELERICLKCLSARMRERYGNGVELARDLRDWLQAQSTDVDQSNQQNHIHVGDRAVDPASVRQSVIPRGLMSFNDQDEKFFLSLLPGTRSRDGTPEQIQYWKIRISSDTDRPPFSVGLIYGPSGCGKSSFVRAGLLPRLPQQIHRVYVESTDYDTESRLLLALRKQFPQLPRDLDLAGTLAELREGDWLPPGDKLLIVLDQFEQWLHAHEVHAGLQLIEGLRHCDGRRLQVIVLVRDDFWMKVTQVFHYLEIQISQEDNYHGLDLFDTEHAKRVLAAFGRAYRKLPIDGSLTAAQEQFLDQAIQRLVERDKIICIHLVMLAETVKDKPWEVESLPRGGHLHKIGIQFLEQCLSHNSNPAFRFYHSAICRVLNLMLPVEGTDIKTRFRDREQLAVASGYGVDSKEFAAVLDILEKQLKLISATDPDLGLSNADTQRCKSADSRYYQLTHDFLVPSVRQWLEQLQSKTPAGRARLRLQSLANGYEQSHDTRFLPTLMEFLDIARHVQLDSFKPSERQVYWRAFKRYATQAALVACFLAILAGVGYQLRIRVPRQSAEDWVTTWITADGTALPAVKSLQIENVFVIEALQSRYQDPGLQPNELSRIDLALALMKKADANSYQRLSKSVGAASLKELPLQRIAFENDLNNSVALLESEYSQTSDDEQAVKIALLLFHLGKPKCLRDSLEFRVDQFRDLTAVHMIGEDADDLQHYIRAIESFPTGIADVHELDVYSGMVKGLSRRDWSQATPVLRSKWELLVTGLMASSPSGPMHSAAEYSLKSVDKKAEFTQDNQIERLEADNKNWFVAPNGLTFVKVYGQGKKLNIPIVNFRPEVGNVPLVLDELRDYWLCATEVPRSLFEKYMKNDSDGEGKEDLRPVCDIPIIDALRFCNELSKAEGHLPYYIELEEPITIAEDESLSLAELEQAKQQNAWIIDVQSTGYRLPSIEEIFFAACNESVTVFPKRLSTEGLSTDLLLGEYCWFTDNSPKGTATENKLKPVGQLMPNALGIFDITGNAYELSIACKNGRLRTLHRLFQVGIGSIDEDIIKPHQSRVPLWHPLKTSYSFRLVRAIK